MSPPAWPLGLALLADALGRDLQRAARTAGGPERLWSATPSALGRALRIEGSELATVVAARRRIDPAAARGRMAGQGVAHIGMPEGAYPPALRELPDPPFGLFVSGAAAAVLPLLASAPVVAIVGARRATAAGRALARELAGELASRGAVIVSGLAHGIDAAAHDGALDAGGTTLAVLGCGVDVPYPRRNRELARRIAGSGVLVSEYVPGTAPAPWRFPARNRIVAGLAGAVAVVEAGRRSGALITADFALEMGRPVLAVPGWPAALASEGCNGLLRAGAALLETADDVVAEMPHGGWSPGPRRDGPCPGGLPARVRDLLAREPADSDALALALGEGPAAVARALAVLEVEGLVVRGEGGRWWACPTSGPARCE